MNSKRIFSSKNKKGIMYKEDGLMFNSKFTLESTTLYQQDFPNLEKKITIETLKNLKSVKQEIELLIKEYEKLNIELNQTKLIFN